MTNHYKIRILLGFSMFIFIIYNRLFRIREDKVLDSLFDLWKFIFFISLALLMVFLTVHNTLIFYKWMKNIEPVEHPLVSRLKNKLSYLINPFKYLFSNLEIFDTYIKNKTPYYDDEKKYTDIIVSYCGLLLEKYSKISVLFGLLAIVFCQSIVLIAFSLDVLYFKKMHYFYIYLWTLIVPMVMQYVIYSIRIYAEANLSNLNNNIYVHLVEDENTFMIPHYNLLPRITLEQHFLFEKSTKYTGYYIHTLAPESLKDPNVDVQKTLDYHRQPIEELCRMKFYTYSWEEKKKNYLSVFNIIKFSVSAYCWFYLALCLWH